MTIRFEPDKHIPVEGKIPSLTAQSKMARQEVSEKPILGFSLNLFLGFIWLITGAWTNASFSDWTNKSNSAVSIAKKMTDDKDLQNHYETHFKALTMDQLNNLEILIKEYPRTTKQYISESKIETPRALHAVLVQMTSDLNRSRRCLTQVETAQAAKIASPGLSFRQSIQKAFNYYLGTR